MLKFSDKVKLFLATGFGSGYLPVAPGSWGSAVAVLVAWWLLDLPLVFYLIVLVVIFFLGIWSVGFADQYFSAKTKNEHDNKNIVIDEWLGQLITLLPVFYFGKSLIVLAVGLFLYRAFDTAKFGLAKYFDHQPNKWGVILDDVFAGLHAAIVFTIVLWICQQTVWLQFVFKL
jgi:phosphatidylglycerophosphatase A